MTASFQARYHGTCGGCGEAIRPGAECAYVKDDPDTSTLWHATCADGDPVPPSADREPVICPACHVARPCWCEGDAE